MYPIRSRLLVVVLMLALLAGCATAPAEAPPAVRVARIGFLGSNAPGPLHDTSVDHLGRLGYVVGQNLTIEYRWAAGRSERLPALAQELAALTLDAIFASGEPAAQALLDAGGGAPIVTAT